MAQQRTQLDSREQEQALKLVRETLETWVREGRQIDHGPWQGALAAPCGAFVTLHQSDGELRGCIGQMVGDGPLGDLLQEMAIAAGTNDPRFPPVTLAELITLRYEISVLSPMQRTRAEDVKPGTHGLLIRQVRRSGVLLPQVAAEHRWDRETFLQQTCRKAGLPMDAWQQPETEIFTFTAQVFGEDHHPTG